MLVSAQVWELRSAGRTYSSAHEARTPSASVTWIVHALCNSALSPPTATLALELLRISPHLPRKAPVFTTSRGGYASRLPLFQGSSHQPFAPRLATTSSPLRMAIKEKLTPQLTRRQYISIAKGEHLACLLVELEGETTWGERRVLIGFLC